MERTETLKLVFAASNSWNQQNGNEDEAMILEALKPHRNLKNLMIAHYTGITMSPSWITSLTNLRDVFIFQCDFCQILPPLGELPSLESLVVRSAGSVSKVGAEFLGITRRNDKMKSNTALQSSYVSFPKLKEVYFDGLSGWEEWEGINIAMHPSAKVMPVLRSLKIEYCPNLKGLPDLIQTIPMQLLSIESCEKLESWCLVESGIEWLKDCHTKNVTLSHGM